ncbi:MAG: ATP-binding protein [Pyrinomonadaceae bacterium]
MLIRPKLFFTFLVLFVVPLLLLGIFNYWNGVRATKAAVRRDLEVSLANFAHNLSDSIKEHEDQIAALARNSSVREYLGEQARGPDPTVPTAELRLNVASVLNDQSSFSTISIFDQNKDPVFVAEQGFGTQPGQGLIFRTKDFLSGPGPEETALSPLSTGPIRSPIAISSLGSTLRLTVPILSSGNSQPLGSVVGELHLDSLFSGVAKGWDLAARNEVSGVGPISRSVVVLDNSGKVLYHTNRALLYRPVNDAMPYFAGLAQPMLAGQSGLLSFTSATGAESEAAYRALPQLGVSVATTQNYSVALAESRRSGMIGLIASVLLGSLAALVMTHYWQRQRRGIERVAKGVAAIAQGKLDHRIEVQSGYDVRPLADDVNQLTAQLRDQLARESEAQQFASFTRLSAMLTHDLKNAIGALSLIVGNMERHFDNEDFRADAMKSLNIATQNLRTLVARLSNPVNTLSGEHKRPQPVDLVPMLRKVIAITAEPLEGTHQIVCKLPSLLVAMVDAERFEKVIENLVLNALEAMAGKSGTLTIEAGKTEAGKPFFSVTDTGSGMSEDFIEKRLYRPFATTKKRGVGLGLYTCREVVRANGGVIEVESVEGAGTTFRVVLPSAAIK